jgi:HAD superfamily hydrolase (TIGR01509 family)
MIQALIFDFDGTILETEGPIFQAWDEVYSSFGQRLLLEDWIKIIGTQENYFNPVDDLEEKLGRRLDWEEIESRRRKREHELVLAQPVLPGVVEYLEAARELGIKNAVASSSTRSWVVGHLERLGLLDYFDCLRTCEDVRLTKPDPELFTSVVQALGVRPDQAVAIEDSPNGIKAAHQAEIFSVAVPNVLTRSLPMPHADLRIDSLASLPLEDLLTAIDKMRSG